MDKERSPKKKASYFCCCVAVVVVVVVDNVCAVKKDRSSDPADNCTISYHPVSAQQFTTHSMQ